MPLVKDLLSNLSVGPTVAVLLLSFSTWLPSFRLRAVRSVCNGDLSNCTERDELDLGRGDDSLLGTVVVVFLGIRDGEDANGLPWYEVVLMGESESGVEPLSDLCNVGGGGVFRNEPRDAGGAAAAAAVRRLGEERVTVVDSLAGDVVRDDAAGGVVTILRRRLTPFSSELSSNDGTSSAFSERFRLDFLFELLSRSFFRPAADEPVSDTDTASFLTTASDCGEDVILLDTATSFLTAAESTRALPDLWPSEAEDAATLSREVRVVLMCTPLPVDDVDVEPSSLRVPNWAASWRRRSSL